MKTFKFISVLTVFLMALAVPAQAQVLDAGGNVDLALAGGLCDTDTEMTPTDVLVKGSAECDETTSAMKALAGIDGILDVAAAARGRATLSYTFEVAADMDNAGNALPGTLSYEISWKGAKTATSGTASVGVLVTMWDTTDSANPVMVAQVTVHEDSLTGGSGSVADASSAMDMADVPLVRGRQYTVVVTLEAKASAPELTVEEITLSDYFDEGGASVVALAVSAGIDLNELAAQVAQNTEDIAANTAAIMALTESVNELKAMLEDLDEAFSSHTHTYLTGKGVGHNNTQATTGTPEDEVEPTPLPSSMEFSKVRKDPLATRSRR
jgi:hypothetical protein